MGEIWVAGDSVSRGYWGRPEATAAAFGATLADTGEGPFVRTGDLGFIYEGELFICGRAKDVIIVRGRNHYPVDIEQTVAALSPHFQRGATVVFQAEVDGREKVVVAQELRPGAEREVDPDALFAAVREAVTAQHGIGVDALVLLERRALPKTSSGKLSRSATRAAWLADELLTVHACGSDEAAAGPADGPTTETEAYLCRLWSEVLGVTVSTRSANFTALGGDSLATVELAARLRDALSLPVTPELVLSRPTLADLATAIDRRDLRPPQADLGAEVWLPFTADDVKGIPAADTDHREIVLTGATGHLGTWLLHALLTQTEGTVHAIVRAADEDAGRARLRAAFERRGLETAALDTRVRVVCGDLGRPRLGLPRARFEALAAAADTVYHCGAQVDWVATYADLRAANVDGTRAVLELARGGDRLSTVHYISTMWVINPEPGIERYGEDRRAGWVGLENGYSGSKWVAENLVHAAAEFGLRATVHRMDFILGDAGMGICAPDDFLLRVVTDIVNTGHAPAEDVPVDVSAADWLARCIVAIGRQTDSEGVYHHVAPEPLRLERLRDLLVALGYRVETEPFDAWRERLARTSGARLHPLRFFLELYSSAALERMSGHIIDNSRARAALERAGRDTWTAHPPMKALIAAALSHLHAEGMIERAPTPREESR